MMNRIVYSHMLEFYLSIKKLYFFEFYKILLYIQFTIFLPRVHFSRG